MVQGGTVVVGEIGPKSSKSATVVFPVPYKNSTYAVTLTHWSGPSKFAVCMPNVAHKATNSMTVSVWNDDPSATSGNIVLNWISVGERGT